MSDDKTPPVLTTPGINFSFTSGATTAPAIRAGSEPSPTVTASPSLASIRHLLSGKPLFRPRKRNSLNALTRKTIEDAESGNDVVRCENSADLFRQLGI